MAHMQIRVFIGLHAGVEIPTVAHLQDCQMKKRSTPRYIYISFSLINTDYLSTTHYIHTYGAEFF